MNKEQRGLKDKVAQAGARFARATLNLKIARMQLDEAENAFMASCTTKEPTYTVGIAELPLEHPINHKISLIKSLRAALGIGLKDAKDIVDLAAATPGGAVVKSGCDYVTAKNIVRVIEDVGVRATLVKDAA